MFDLFFFFFFSYVFQSYCVFFFMWPSQWPLIVGDCDRRLFRSIRALTRLQNTTYSYSILSIIPLNM